MQGRETASRAAAPTAMAPPLAATSPFRGGPALPGRARRFPRHMPNAAFQPGRTPG